jgi:hypothetical protein
MGGASKLRDHVGIDVESVLDQNVLVTGFNLRPVASPARLQEVRRGFSRSLKAKPRASRLATADGSSQDDVGTSEAENSLMLTLEA